MSFIKRKDDSEKYGLVLADVLVQMFIIFVFFFTMAILLPHSNDENTNKIPVGNLCVELSWPNDRNIDLDLWGHSPHDPATIGFSNMHGNNLNLFRDVVGYNMNPSHIMFELECSNELTPGEWTFDVNYFSNHEDKPSDIGVDATVTVRIKYGNGKEGGDIFVGHWHLTKEGEEKTIFDFVLDKDGHLIKDSINSNNIPLKGGWHHQ